MGVKGLFISICIKEDKMKNDWIMLIVVVVFLILILLGSNWNRDCILCGGKLGFWEEKYYSYGFTMHKKCYQTFLINGGLNGMQHTEKLHSPYKN